MNALAEAVFDELWRPDTLGDDFGYAEKIESSRRARLPFASKPRVAPPLWAVKSPRRELRLKKPVALTIHVETDAVFVENDSLAIFAHGATIEEAMADFMQHLIYFHDHYAALRGDQVIGKARKLKKLYAEIFV